MSEIKSVRPDILDCLANLSSDEVFTPPKVVNEMLDMLPQDLFENPKTRFLDPFTKSGVFLREIVKRLDKGLVRAIPDKEDRLNHIFQRQVYGIACTQLTALFSRRSLYCNKNVQDKRSTARGLFSTEAGNIGYHRCHHTWVNGSCKVCGASKKALSESKDVENYAYPFLHDEVFMKQAQELGFDVIIGNPPYQIDDGGNSASAKPLYHKFVKAALGLNARYTAMIIPARWYSGGKGLDEFRETMLTDRHIKRLVDYADSSECFPGVSVAGGVCYFLRDRDYEGDCEVVNFSAGKVCSEDRRSLSEFATFVRDNRSIRIIHQVQGIADRFMSEVVCSRNSFALPSNATGHATRLSGDFRLYSSKGTSWVCASEVADKNGLVKKYKVAITYAMSGGNKPGADGKYQILSSLGILSPNEVCTETYLILYSSRTRSEVENVKSYLATRFARFLLLQALSSIHITKASFAFVPMQDFSKPWTDAELYRKYKLTDQEIEFIESMIRPME